MDPAAKETITRMFTQLSHAADETRVGEKSQIEAARSDLFSEPRMRLHKARTGKKQIAQTRMLTQWHQRMPNGARKENATKSRFFTGRNNWNVSVPSNETIESDSATNRNSCMSSIRNNVGDIERLIIAA